MDRSAAERVSALDGQCPNISGCCRDSADCALGDVCCASTAAPLPNTTFTCKSPLDCSTALGKAVCSVPGANGCAPGAMHPCLGAIYSQAPNPSYFDCS